MKPKRKNRKRTPPAEIDAGLCVMLAVAAPGETFTKAEIAEVCGCSTVYIGMIEKSALAKLRPALSRRGFNCCAPAESASVRRRRVFHFIKGYIESNEEPPTIAEIGQHFQISSSASVHGILSALERDGLIKRIPNISRGIALVPADQVRVTRAAPGGRVARPRRGAVRGTAPHRELAAGGRP